MSGKDWEKAIAERDGRIAELEQQVANAAKNVETAKELRSQIAELKAERFERCIDPMTGRASIRCKARNDGATSGPSTPAGAEKGEGASVSSPSGRDTPKRLKVSGLSPQKKPLYRNLFGEGDVCRGEGTPGTHPRTLPATAWGAKASGPARPWRWSAW